VCCVASAVFAEKKSNVGEEKFKALCAVCHPDGGNIVNPKKTLQKKDLEANNIKTANDIIKVMRNPGPGMNVFSEKTLPDKDARAIAEYILKTFK
jgi:cytochrome c6